MNARPPVDATTGPTPADLGLTDDPVAQVIDIYRHMGHVDQQALLHYLAPDLVGLRYSRSTSPDPARQRAADGWAPTGRGRRAA